VIDRRPQGRAVLNGKGVASEDLLLRWDDPAAQWGLGVFETVAVRGDAPCDLAEHLERLRDAARRFGVPLPAALELDRAARAVADGGSPGARWLKIVASRSGQWAVFGGPFDPASEGAQVSAVVLPWRRHRHDPAAGLKAVGDPSRMLGLEEARRRGAEEGLWLNERGHVIGACTGNVFVVRGRAVVTPSLRDGARDGVTRARAIRELRVFGLSVRQAKVRLATLRAANEIFLTSSLRGVRAVVRLDGRTVRRGDAGPITRRLANVLVEDGVRQGA
jgi:branched-chain amino acid aminotransferase